MDRTDLTDLHALEPIDGECPRCRLPVYRSDPRRWSRPPWDSTTRIWHSGCAIAAEGEFWEKQVESDVQRLRGCGYVVQLQIVRPVR